MPVAKAIAGGIRQKFRVKTKGETPSQAALTCYLPAARVLHGRAQIPGLSIPSPYKTTYQRIVVRRHSNRLMKRMLQILIFTALFANQPAWPQAAPGGSKRVEVTPANLNEHPFGFRVSTESNMIGLPNEDTIRFTVQVTERNQSILPESHGSFWVASGHDFITWLNVAPVRDGKSLKFEFDLARKYLGGDTSFTFVAIRAFINPGGGESKLGDFYSFTLPQFTTK